MDTKTLTASEEAFLDQVGAKVDGHEFTIRELREAFDGVAPKPNWKDRIDAVVPYDAGTIAGERQVALVRAAVAFMTGESPIVTRHTRLNGETVLIVTGRGYYATVGA